MAAPTSRLPLVTSVAIKRPLSLGFKFVLLFLTLLTIASSIMAWHSEREHKRARSSLLTADISLTRVSAELEAISLRESLRDIQLKQQQVAIDSLLADGPALRQRWLIDRIDAAVTVAEQALILRQDAPAARRALAAADALLNEQRVESLEPLRRALEQDISTLSAIEPVDASALYLRLSALQVSSDRLAVAAHQSLPATPTKAPSTSSAMTDLWQQGLSKFRELIVVRHHDEPMAPVLDDTRLSLLRSQLDAQIMQAQVALLRGDSVLYRAALESVSRRIQSRLAALSATQTEPLLNELADLQAQPVMLDAPALVSRAALTALPTLGGEH
ncbi:MAG: uroporphyrinogen-III C-methyltransferase [Paraperlucidibaca sp.]